MRSDRPKVLHEVANRSMLGHVLAAVTDAGASPHRRGRRTRPREGGGGGRAPRCRCRDLRSERSASAPAHAVLSAREALAPKPDDDVIVVYADTPLVSTETLATLREPFGEEQRSWSLGFEAA